VDSLKNRLVALLPKLYAVARKRLARSSLRHEAEDLVHDTLLYVMKNEERYAQTPELFEWLCVALSGRISNMGRNRNKQYALLKDRVAHEPVAHESRTPYQQLERLQHLRCCHEIMEELPERVRRIFIRWAIDDMSHGEIAKKEQLPLGTVKSDLRRMRQRLAAGR
jgi:RNA polymerase sigma-70 factor (ECF subfamily)